MNISKTDLIKQLKQNNGHGIITYEGKPCEIELLTNGEISFTGMYWDWKTVTVTSSHQDYSVETDQFLRKRFTEVPNFPDMSRFDFYFDVNDYLQA
ncbi:hypothetical protein [Bacillus sp. FJAT-47783]|uniref:hypothetical protein n=1 Tax=Bacillus sp. FJAT-47783 TaxID=2922712 RepID=UPI001FACBB7A|nr:hypothetical protein [Bacillus sp. FJAT-47783]